MFFLNYFFTFFLSLNKYTFTLVTHFIFSSAKQARKWPWHIYVLKDKYIQIGRNVCRVSLCDCLTH